MNKNIMDMLFVMVFEIVIGKWILFQLLRIFASYFQDLYILKVSNGKPLAKTTICALVSRKKPLRYKIRTP